MGEPPADTLKVALAPLFAVRLAGWEVIVGGVRDASWGPCVVLGLGGVTAEALADSSVRLAPVTRVDVEEMIEGLRGKRLLEGFRNLPKADHDAICQAVIAIGRLLCEHPEVREVEINPLRVNAQGAVALDGLVLVDDTH